MTTAVREERRLVTCMFVDVVGSTELTMRLGAERLKRELGAAFTEISGIVTAHGGTVEKYVGDAIYALFGAPVAHEDDPVRALRAAQALREWCAAGAAHGHPFMVRVGIETGEAIVDLEAAQSTRQQMSVGPVVNIAARLQQRAEPGEVLVGPSAREAARDSAELEAVGQADLKGIGQVAVWRLVRVGLPSRPALSFVGRHAELELLQLAHQRAQKGRSVLAIVLGPPGQGKTRLVQEFLDQRAQAAHLITARCRPVGETGVFAPVRDILGVTTLDVLAEQVGRICSDDVECERVVAGLAESAGIAASASLAKLPAAEREDEIVQAWRRYLGLLGSERLVLLAIDDLHWADPSLVKLVDRITFGGPRVLVVATARPEFAEASGIRPSGDRFFIELEGLDEEEAARLAREAGGDDARVVARAEGNPLFIVELARSRTATADELPLTLQGALGARLDQIGPADRALLSLAAVAGERFTAEDVAFLTGRDPAETARTVERLVDLHFLDLAETGYRFHHGLVRDVAYGRILGAERMRAHARFARERVHSEDAAALAHHWWEALRPPDAEWVWAGDPGLPAMRREAFRAHLAAGAAHADHFAVDLAVGLLERARGFAGDDRELAMAHHALGKAHQRVLRQDETWAHLMRAIELFRGSGGVPVEAYVDAAQATYYTGAFRQKPSEAEVTTLIDEGAAAAEAAGDRRSLALLLLARARYLSILHGGEPEMTAPHVDRAIAAAEASGDAETHFNALRLKAVQLTNEGRLVEVGPVLEEMGRSLGRADAVERLLYFMRLSWQHLLMADLDADEEVVGRMLALAEVMGPHNRTHAWGQAAELYAARGDWDKAIELAQRTAKLVREEKESAFCGMAGESLRDGAIAHALRGAREEALALVRLIPTNDSEVDAAVQASVPRAILGFPSPEADAHLGERRRGWWNWSEAVVRAVVLGRADDAEAALANMAPVTETSPAYRALAEDVRAAIAEMRGGPPARYEALRRIGFHGWADVLARRAVAEY